jgi:hypothetical protein
MFASEILKFPPFERCENPQRFANQDFESKLKVLKESNGQAPKEAGHGRFLKWIPKSPRVSILKFNTLGGLGIPPCEETSISRYIYIYTYYHMGGRFINGYVWVCNIDLKLSSSSLSRSDFLFVLERSWRRQIQKKRSAATSPCFM